MKQTRYIYKTVPLAKEDADNQRQREFRHIMNQICELHEEAAKLCDSPLPTTRQVQIELNPGDEGYEDAPIRFDSTQYQGNVTWQNIENSTPLKPEELIYEN